MLKKVKKSNAPSTKQPAGGGAAVKKRKASPPNSETVINERMSAPLESLAGTNEMSHVIGKFVIFSILTPLIPFLIYVFASKNIFPDNKTHCAIAAVVAANACLITYIVLAIIEEKKKK